jgi:hypothetical protein
MHDFWGTQSAPSVDMFGNVFFITGQTAKAVFSG